MKIAVKNVIVQQLSVQILRSIHVWKELFTTTSIPEGHIMCRVLLLNSGNLLQGKQSL